MHVGFLFLLLCIRDGLGIPEHSVQVEHCMIRKHHLLSDCNNVPR